MHDEIGAIKSKYIYFNSKIRRKVKKSLKLVNYNIKI
jgi:hypothetical protein